MAREKGERLDGQLICALRGVGSRLEVHCVGVEPAERIARGWSPEEALALPRYMAGEKPRR